MGDNVEGNGFKYISGELPELWDQIYAGNEHMTEEFVTVVKSVSSSGEYVTTAGWPECIFPVKYCRLVRRGEPMV